MPILMDLPGADYVGEGDSLSEAINIWLHSVDRHE
jgi:hypothetical protein